MSEYEDRPYSETSWMLEIDAVYQEVVNSEQQ